MTALRLSWTQPCCASCWLDLNPGRKPTRMFHAEPEQCCHCGAETSEGIYIRVDPVQVPFATRKKDE